MLLIMLKLNAKYFLHNVYFLKIQCVPIILKSIRFLNNHVHKTWTCGWAIKSLQAEYLLHRYCSIFEFVSKGCCGYVKENDI